MKKTNQLTIQAKLFEFALFDLVRNQRDSFKPLWTVDSWVKFLIWLSLNCGLTGEKESLENFADSVGSSLTIRMRKIFFERTLENLALHVMADPADSKVLLMPLETGLKFSNDLCKQALDDIGLTEKVINNDRTWEFHDQLIAIPWKS